MTSPISDPRSLAQTTAPDRTYLHVVKVPPQHNGRASRNLETACRPLCDPRGPAYTHPMPSVQDGNLMTKPLALAFAAGFIAVLIFHQSVVAALVAGGGARNGRVEKLDFEAVTHHKACDKKAGCVHSERFQIIVPVADLETAPASGYRLKVIGRAGGDTTITIPRGAIDRVSAAAGRANSTSPPARNSASP